VKGQGGKGVPRPHAGLRNFRNSVSVIQKPFVITKSFALATDVTYDLLFNVIVYGPKVFWKPNSRISFTIFENHKTNTKLCYYKAHLHKCDDFTKNERQVRLSITGKTAVTKTPANKYFLRNLMYMAHVIRMKYSVVSRNWSCFFSWLSQALKKISKVLFRTCWNPVYFKYFVSTSIE